MKKQVRKNNLPHVIYLLSDEHNPRAMSHMGDPNVRTPVMDRLAREGVSFARSYANCPLCTPSRGTIFSGRHAHSGPVSGFFDVYKATAPSTATLLRREGYHSAYFGKWHCGTYPNQRSQEVLRNPEAYKGTSARTPEHHRAGFQDWRGFENLNQHFASYYYKDHEPDPIKLEGYETDGQTNLVIDYLKNYEREEPLFLVLSVTPPHFPLVVPEKWKRFDPAKLAVRENFGRLDDWFVFNPETSEADLRECLANYYAMIENLDWNLGRLMDTLAGLEQFRDNTLTVYFSDHGDYMGSHGLFNRKESHFEESVRIPAIFHWPGRIPARGVVDEGLFSLVDLMPTTLGLVQATVPPHSQGADFSPLLRGEPFAGPDAVLLEMHNIPRWDLSFIDWRGLVSKKWKYVFCETGREGLWDLENDPGELRNVAAEQPAECAAMRRKLLDLLRATREPYFDVLIEHGAKVEEPVLDVATHPAPRQVWITRPPKPGERGRTDGSHPGLT